MDAVPALELRAISKRFGSVIANDAIDLRIARGEIRAIVGENGAGKTTLMQILYGLIAPDSGTIRIDGRLQRFRSSLDAIRAGFGMVHQHFMLFASLSVYENVIVGAEPAGRYGFVQRRRAMAEVAALAARFALALSPQTKIKDLPVGLKQGVEILKMLYRQASILILDEPTAVLTAQERDRLLAMLRQLAADGKTIVFISHKLPEVFDLADSISVLRRGRLTGTWPADAISDAELARQMVGHPVVTTTKKSVSRGRCILDVKALTVTDEHGGSVVGPVSFTVHAGEIVAIAGVSGNGQHELIEALSGLRPASGTIALDGRDISRCTIGQRYRAGLAYIPEDRLQTGLAPAATLAENLLIGRQRLPAFAVRGWLRIDAIRAFAATIIQRYQIKTAAADRPLNALSGGNQQKLLLARELEKKPNTLLLVEQPTRGVDIAAGELIHRRLLEARARGTAQLLVSSELDEIRRLADRILVMFNGRIVAERTADKLSEYELGRLMSGAGSRTLSLD